jgi:site-specific recombinase XerD
MVKKTDVSRQAMLCSPGTIRFYHFTAGKFLQYIENQNVVEPYEVTARHVRFYLSKLANKGLSDSYIHGHARAIRTLLKFWFQEKYIPEPIVFTMPAMSRKRLPVLSADEVKIVLAACRTKRDKALVLLLVDSGIRRAEACASNWGDVDIQSGLVRIERGKGGKARSVVVGVKTRRALLAYRREVNHNDDDPLIQTSTGNRFTYSGLRSALLRVGTRAGIHVTPHALRRTFATLSLRAGMNLIQLQAMLGHGSLEMTRQYIQMIDDDLLEAHEKYGPIDKFL